MKQKIITILLTLVVTLVPLVFYKNSVSTFALVKFIVLVILSVLLLILFLCNYKKVKIDEKDIVILCFLGIVFLSAFLCNNIKVALLGERQRYEGLIAFCCYVIIYLCSKKFFKYEKLQIFINITYIVALIIGIIGILQNYIYFPPLFKNSIIGTFGNSNFFGGFISIVLPISIISFILKGNKMAFLLANVMFFCMISSGTRSAWVAFAVICLLGLIYLIKEKNKKYFKRLAILIVCFTIIFIYLFNGFNFVKKQPTKTSIKLNQLVTDIKTASTDGIRDNMGSSRIKIWKMTLDVIYKNTIIGCGPDNLRMGYYRYSKEGFLDFYNRVNAVPDKAHNEYLQIAASLGIPALGLYLIFIAAILIPKMQKMFNNKAYLLISLTITSYLVQAFFNISTIGISQIFWVILGLADNQDLIDKLNKKIN